MCGTDTGSPCSLYRLASNAAIIIGKRLSIARRGDKQCRSMGKVPGPARIRLENNARQILGKSWRTSDFEAAWRRPLVDVMLRKTRGPYPGWSLQSWRVP